MNQRHIASKYWGNTGMSTIELSVLSAIAVLIVMGLYSLLKNFNVLENIIIWFRNCFARGIVNI